MAVVINFQSAENRERSATNSLSGAPSAASHPMLSSENGPAVSW
jgi:hypothetical protein